MRHTTLFPKELRDLIIGLVAFALAVIIWSIFIVPAV
jgi:hypothetical protein